MGRSLPCLTRVNCGSTRSLCVRSSVISMKIGAEKIYLRNSSKKSTLLTSLLPWKLIGSWFKLLIFSRIYDYYKLSNILTLQSSAFQNILTTFRPHPEYFKVSFFGGSYPLFVRNKEFIYRGLDFEKISDFTHRLCAEFPEANLVTKVDKFHYM